MSLNLDKRQRAMLREMGVRVWQPLATPEVPEKAAPAAIDASRSGGFAINNIAVRADFTGAEGRFDHTNAIASDTAALVTPPVAARALAAKTQPVPAASQNGTASFATAGAHWGIGPPQALYLANGGDGEAAKTGARWLVLAEMPSATAKPSELFNPFEGEAGKLLDNMLRAAKLRSAAAVYLVPLVRNTAHGTSPAGFEPCSDPAAALPAISAIATPDIVLVMGRFASQWLLQTDTPFGRLRGQVHTLCGRPAVVTLDATYLLRNQADKARAWDDLRLAMRLAARG